MEIDYQQIASIPTATALLSTYYEGVHLTTLPISSSKSAASIATTAPAALSPVTNTITLGTPTASPAASNVKTGSATLSTAAKVGIAVGVTLPAVIIAALIIWRWRCHRRPPQALYQNTDESSTDETQHVPFTEWQPPRELWGGEVGTELEGNQRIEELDANSRIGELEGHVFRT